MPYLTTCGLFSDGAFRIANTYGQKNWIYVVQNPVCVRGWKFVTQEDKNKKSIWFTPLNQQQTYLLFAIISMPISFIIIYLQYFSLYVQNPFLAHLIPLSSYTPPSFYGYFMPFAVVMLLMMALPIIIYFKKSGRILTSIIVIIGGFSTFFIITIIY